MLKKNGFFILPHVSWLGAANTALMQKPNAGTYTVNWRASAKDGHHGHYAFMVAP